MRTAFAEQNIPACWKGSDRVVHDAMGIFSKLVFHF